MPSTEALIQQAHAEAAGRLVLTTSGGETSALMPHLVASVIGRTFTLIFVDHGFYGSATYRQIDYFRQQGYDLYIYRSTLTPGDIERHYSGWRDPAPPFFSLVLRKIKHEPLNRAFADLHRPAGCAASCATKRPNAKPPSRFSSRTASTKCIRLGTGPRLRRWTIYSGMACRSTRTIGIRPRAGISAENV